MHKQRLCQHKGKVQAKRRKLKAEVQKFDNQQAAKVAEADAELTTTKAHWSQASRLAECLDSN